MRLRITQSAPGSVDGIDLSRYVEGCTYDVGTTLANYLLAQGWAVPVDGTAAAAELGFHRVVQHPSILVVEDDEDMRTILTQLLTYHGWRSHAASDGAEGLRALMAYRPSLILLDLAMPRMDGVEFRAAQRELGDESLAAVPIVIVSAVHDARAYQSRLNAADVLVKPFDAERLVQAVETHARPNSLFRW